MGQHNLFTDNREILGAVAKVIAALTSLILPIYLTRAMSVHDYGVYKQITLIWIFSFQVLGFGIDHGLFYFVGQDKENAPLYSLNVVGFNLLTAATLIGIISFSLNAFSQIINNPEIVELWPSLSALILFSVPAQHLEHYLLILNYNKAQFGLQVITELGKTLIILGVFYFFRDLKTIFVILSAYFFFRLLILIGVNLFMLKKFKINLSLEKQLYLLKRQLKFGLPLGFSKLAEAFMSWDKFFIGRFWGIEKFALYSVGTMDVPLLPAVANNFLDVMAIDMVSQKKDQNKIVKIWCQSIRKVFLLISIPILFALSFSKDLILLVYGEKFGESVSIFQWHLLNFMILCLNVEIIYRIFNKTKKLAALYSGYVLISVLGFYFSAKSGSILLPLKLKLFFSLGYIVIILHDSKKYLGLQWNNLLPWKEFTHVVLALSFVLSLIHLFLYTVGIKEHWLAVTIGAIVYLLSTIFIFHKLGYWDASLVQRIEKIRSHFNEA